ncbi:forkhead box protein N1 isoform X2 [Parambassis ranga]|uniref:Forkhead box protein N1 isoform X2 n=1 Tax=Parambassis ranga TaxID=210632 RepID=A0A6P7JDK3_9TELE|nr:uncharacterized protein LOC114444509 isoform X2 [Parambassis ranga]
MKIHLNNSNSAGSRDRCHFLMLNLMTGLNLIPIHRIRTKPPPLLIYRELWGQKANPFKGSMWEKCKMIEGTMIPVKAEQQDLSNEKRSHFLLKLILTIMENKSDAVDFCYHRVKEARDELIYKGDGLKVSTEAATLSENIRLELQIHKEERGHILNSTLRSRFWCRMSHSMTFSPSRSKSRTSTPQVSLHTCEPRGTSCQQMAESQESNTFSLRTAAVNRRYSADGIIDSGSTCGRGPVDSDHFHPYQRQFSDGAVATAGCLQDICGPDTCSHGCSSETPSSWDDFSNIQSPYPELPAAPVEPGYSLAQNYSPYSSSNLLPQASSRLFPNNKQACNSKYSVQSLCAPSHKDVTTQSRFPKPIYSYSILIFMALKNSKTGSLPVSEIYSFMTEHFPYFKTAPDGWKNSVRHNLSLNKCFEKVENKNGSTSRKGCLWTLNPAKVDKMQEELHKWRRKDPVTVRRSMARPDLDRLLGERPNKLRSLPPYTSPALLPRMPPIYGATSSSCALAQLRPGCSPFRHPQHYHIHPEPPCYLPPATAQPSNPFALYSPCGQQLAADTSSAGSGSLNSPIGGKIPPAYSAALQAEYSVGHRSMQDSLLEGDTSYDVDTLNPSLIDLQLQGNLWEELRDDSFVSTEPHVTTTTSSSTSAVQDDHTQTSCLQDSPPGSQTPPGTCRKYEDVGQNVEQYGCLNGLPPVVYSGVESLAGYLTSCTTSISLL